MIADGFVTYVDAQQAQQLNLLRMQGNQVYMGVDSTTVLKPDGPGRKSVRIESKKTYNQALVIADFHHVPGSACGSWPALCVLPLTPQPRRQLTRTQLDVRQQLAEPRRN